MDNAKKYYEAKGMKRSEQHKATVMRRGFLALYLKTMVPSRSPAQYRQDH
jgi:Na+/H+-translocating membrane pyrophosphatase